MKPASNQLSNISFKLEVLLDIGSYTDSFFYLDGNNLGVEVGDIVMVTLKRRSLNGLVIAKSSFLNQDNSYVYGDKTKGIKYLDVERIIQKKIIQDWWREWLEALACFYHVVI